ncbi:MAG: DUF3291 domain-containing protein [Alphaproteobacteria bacterium]|nr:DUF3291 domain-containing protein [Alphaproteobacteria bacterium]
MHLAELNIGRFKYPTSDPRMAGFIDNLDLVNAIAERSAGFVWRLKGDNNNATEFRIGDDMAVNLSVWENAQALENFVFNTIHVKFYRKKEQWFDVADKMHMVLWYVPEGHEPTLDEAWERLQDYEQNGPSERAFGWAEVMDIERMRALRCA